jgi:hypothetical protein
MATDYIEAAHAKSFWAKVRRISVDETSAREAIAMSPVCLLFHDGQGG